MVILFFKTFTKITRLLLSFVVIKFVKQPVRSSSGACARLYC